MCNHLYDGDNLQILKTMQSDYVHLVYLDPPFNSNRNYNSLYTDPTGTTHSHEVQQFEDVWWWNIDSEVEIQYNNLLTLNKPAYKYISYLIDTYGKVSICAYLVFMTVRLIEIHRVLKDTGSIYLHCDPTADYHLRIIMDSIFGANNFRNSIAWCYTGISRTKTAYPKKHDTVLFYTKSNEYTFHSKGDTIDYIGIHGGSNQYGKLDKEERDEFYKVGKTPEDYWDIEREDVFNIPSGGCIKKSELVGYPTQKPTKLLDRIIKMSSNEGILY